MSEYIKREDAIMALTAVECDDIVAKEALALLPAADAAPVVHGTWEESIFKGFVQCSVCHDCCVDDDWVDGKKWGWCPRCGAKMDGGDDDAESADNV